jgi:MYXO-CTERM domain-containing protein
MSSKPFVRSLLLGAASLVALLAAPSSAQACGGLFCSSPNQPVNQAAEKIIFSANGDGTVTAVIQIQYQGTASKFSWLLPISSVPTAAQIGVASNLGFQRLQTATNPQYTLTTRIEGTCRQVNNGLGFPSSAGTGGATSVGVDSGGPGRGVTVEASGTVGAFDWTVISIDASVAEPSDVAVKWLEDNGYSVGEGAPGLIKPYLMDGLHLLALRLSKGSDVGSIRPLMLTYDAKNPMIPIKLTAVAANDDMGVMTWILSDTRAVPQNYLALELNEARINWFNASSNYNAVVTAAADEAGGQGFVTEFAGKTSSLPGVVWGSSDEAQWQNFRTTTFSGFGQMFDSAFGQWSQWDGFWDAARESITLPGTVTFADFQACPNCYSSQIQLTPSVFFAALDKNVMKPMRDVQALLGRSGYVTRLYSTLSAAEMTVDPLFTFNPGLGDLSNQHNATRVIECDPSLDQFQAPWRIELPQGGVVRGGGSQVGTWPAFDDQPSNARIVRVSASGTGAVVEDNAQEIKTSLTSYNAAYPARGSSSDGAVPQPSTGCSASGAPAGSGWGFAAALGALIALKRRRR